MSAKETMINDLQNRANKLAEDCLEENDLTETDYRYDELRSIFAAAVFQAEEGKGKDRHANGEPWGDQLHSFLSRFDHATGQAIKKLVEAHDFFYKNGDLGGAINEILGAMNYSASRIKRLRDILHVEHDK